MPIKKIKPPCTSGPAASALFIPRHNDGPIDEERLSVAHVARELYEIAQIPCHAGGVSLGDIIEATWDAERLRHVFQRVVVKTGNRTVRIAFAARAVDDDQQALIVNLSARGCTFRVRDELCIAMNVPQHVDMVVVVDMLEEEDMQWEHGDWAGTRAGRATPYRSGRTLDQSLH